MLVIIHSCLTTATIEIQNPPSPQEVPFNLFGVIPTLAPATSDLFFYHYGFAFSRISDKWNRAACSLCMWLLSLSGIYLRLVISGIRGCSSFLLSGFALCGRTTI